MLKLQQPAGTITRSNGKSVIATMALPSRREHIIAVHGHDGAALSRVLTDAMAARSAHALDCFIFGRSADRTALHSTAPNHPMLWYQGSGGSAEMISIQGFAVSGTRPEPVHFPGCSGFVYEDEHARYCRLNAAASDYLDAPRETQTLIVLQKLAAALKANGFRFTDTVRTWFYLDRLLDWYAEFNTVRTAFFQEHGVFDKMVPASTGIGAANSYGAALTCTLLAVQPKPAGVLIHAVTSPLQCSAQKYKSSFSRAVELDFPAYRSLMISGTASIDPDGKTAHVGDYVSQIDLTMRVINALLKSRAMSWDNLIRGIAYFKDPGKVLLFERYCREHAIPKFPLAVVHADVCRKDLLFELEADAIAEKR